MDAWDEETASSAATAALPFRLRITTLADAATPLPPLPPGAGLSIPELGLEWGAASSTGLAASTPAALLARVRADLGQRRVNGGDASAEWTSFWARFEAVEAGRAPWTLVVGGEDE